MTILSAFSVILIIVSLVAYYSVGKNQWMVLLATSAVYFAVFSPIGFLCIVIETAIVYCICKKPSASDKETKTVLFSSLLVILLFYFGQKYLIPTLFQQNNNNSLLNTYNLVSIPFTLGSAYFLLRLVSFVLDRHYSKTITAETDYRQLLGYLIYFPTLTQGPVERYGSFVKKTEGRHVFSSDNLVRAVFLILYGLFKILAISKVCAQYSGDIFVSPEETYSVVYILFCIVMYSVQIYADFSGGIDVIRGISYLYGIELVDNFKTPYFSTSFSEFWKRWHISFSSWLKDYVYIPLGGSRKGKARKLLNIIIVFTVSGLWHGISATFLIWGLLQAAYTISESYRKNRKDRKPFWKRAGVFAGMSFSWIFFNASTMGDISQFFKNLYRSVLDIPSYFSSLTAFAEENGTAAALRLKLDIYTKSAGIRYLVCFLLVLVFFTVLEYHMYKKDLDIASLVKNNRALAYVLSFSLLAVIVLFGFWGESYSASYFIYGGF